MAEATMVGAGAPAIRIKRIELDRPWQWLAAGWQDFRRAPAVGVVYGVLAALTGYLILVGLWLAGMPYLILPLLAGFLIVGPALTVGLYEVARRREGGQETTFFEALAARNPGQADGIAAARRRLCDDEGMGRLFKVIALAAPGWPMPAGLE